MRALQRAKIAPQDVDAIITVSCTGFLIPSLDAYLAPDLGLRANVRRLPVTELGCAAGAAGLSLARDYVLAHPGAPDYMYGFVRTYCFMATGSYSKEGFTYADDASLLREGIIDSLGVVELVTFLQSRFGLKIEQSEVRPENFDSVAKLAAFVRRKQTG